MLRLSTAILLAAVVQVSYGYYGPYNATTCLNAPGGIAPTLFPFDLICGAVLKGSPTTNLTLQAFELACATDCRCTHGATSGKCVRLPETAQEEFTCLCDYSSPILTPTDIGTVDNVLDIVCPNAGIQTAELCGTPLQELERGGACQADCGCFHSQNGRCRPTASNPDVSYCYCGEEGGDRILPFLGPNSTPAPTTTTGSPATTSSTSRPILGSLIGRFIIRD